MVKNSCSVTMAVFHQSIQSFASANEVGAPAVCRQYKLDTGLQKLGCCSGSVH